MSGKFFLLFLSFSYCLVFDPANCQETSGGLGRFMPRKERGSEQQSPSLEETINWLDIKMIDYSHINFHFGLDSQDKNYIDYGFGPSRLKDFDPSDCSLTLEKRYYWARRSKQRGFRDSNPHFSDSFSLSDLDLASISITHVSSAFEYFGINSVLNEDERLWSGDGSFYALKVKTVGNRNLIIRSGQEPRDPRPDMDFLYTKDKEMAERCAKALRHAISLCQGKKKEPF